MFDEGAMLLRGRRGVEVADVSGSHDEGDDG